MTVDRSTVTRVRVPLIMGSTAQLVEGRLRLIAAPVDIRKRDGVIAPLLTLLLDSLQ